MEVLFEGAIISLLIVGFMGMPVFFVIGRKAAEREHREYKDGMTDHRRYMADIRSRYEEDDY